MNINNDESIMHEFKAGNKTGFDLMFNALFVHLLQFAARIIKNEDDAKDIVMVVIESLFQRHKEFETFGNVRAFSFVSVKNKCLTYIEYREKFADINTFDVPSEEYIDAQLIRSEFLQTIYQEIEDLSPMRKSVFKLFYLDGLSIPEISKQLNIDPSAVYNNKKRALDQLKNIITSKNKNNEVYN